LKIASGDSHVVVVAFTLPTTFEFEIDKVSGRLVVLEAESAVELAFSRHAVGGVGINLKETAVIL
jgi:hypothetical protein